MKDVTPPGTAADRATANEKSIPEKERLWNDLQHRFALEQIALIDFSRTSLKATHWQLLFNEENYQRISTNAAIEKGMIRDEGFWQESNVFNSDLKLLMLPETKPTSFQWTKFSNQLQIEGYLIPQSDISDLPLETLEIWLSFFNRLLEAGCWSSTFRYMKQRSVQQKLRQPGNPATFLWSYLIHLTKVTKLIAKKDAAFLKQLNKVFPAAVSPAQIRNYLPSHQAWLLMMAQWRSQWLEPLDDRYWRQLVDHCWPATKKFWSEVETAISIQIRHGFRVPNAAKKKQQGRDWYLTAPELLRSFYVLHDADQSFLMIQHLLNEGRKSPLTQALPAEVVEKYLPPESEVDQVSVWTKLRGGFSIVDRLQHKATEHSKRHQFSFSQQPVEWPWQKEASWYQLNDQALTDLAKAVRKNLQPKKDALAEQAVLQQRMAASCALLNRVTAPFFNWTAVEEVLVPSWNAAPYNNTLTLRQQLEEKLRLYGKEHKRLKRELTHLQEQHHVLKLEKMAEQHAAYAFTALKEEWTFAYRQQLEKVRSQEANRYRRMLEFGLLEKGEAATYEHNLWLDELLQIEREVSPYLAFAKSAFSMALPSRRSVEFDPYRHSWDGIEFDPQTVYDRRKWMRGDVMKMLRGKVSKANAEQINCFLLDASGSMKGERMRNLFKLIYLLVLGLEGRRTFDSYHFFGSNFVEGANFSGTYTDRSILFRILRKIAKLHKWKIKYSGAGGTNISDAVRQAHGRLLTFAEEQTDKHPDTFYFKSIFVITDGVPSVGIRDEQKLGVFIEEKRAEGDVSIKGLYLKPEGDNDFEFMQEVFGSGNYVVTAQFAEAIKQLIFITSNTYKLQRKDLKYALRKAKMK